MELNIGTTCHGFAIGTREDLPEIDGVAYVGRHEASGARLLYLANDDNNKSFAIGFRTPPKDDTGVFHILEHSVLCGSRRFPVKEPFVDLLKSSMQTFLNAMTFADKTLYPVASTNEQDLFNLMDVYLDAVFHPNIYAKRQIFEQEGWHYELHANPDRGVRPSDAGELELAPTGSDATSQADTDSENPVGAQTSAPCPNPAELELAPTGSDATSQADTDSENPVGAQTSAPCPNPAELPADQTVLIHNGVVFNEMKGALSDASSVLYDELQAALLPDTCYAFESGGTPKAIPTLTYEDYLDEHRRHYRTDNSYIILYGNLDIDRALAFLDERYLAPVAAEQRAADEERLAAGLELLRPREIALQQPVRAGYIRRTMDTAPENACAACGYVIGDSSDRVRAMAVEILLDALFGSNESPLTRALLDAGIAHDVSAYVSDALRQPFAVVQVNMPIDDGGKRLADAVDEAVRAMLEAGLDMNLVEAALSHAEFQMREHDMGYADGVIDAMVALSSWLYDENAALDYLRYERAFAQLREELDGPYFEQLCKDLFLENPHTAAVEIVPTPGVSDDDSAERLAAMNRALQLDERERLVKGEALLRELQEAPDAPEAAATLPRLGVSDIGEAPEEPPYCLMDDAPVPYLRHSVQTHGIAYAYQYFDMRRLAFEDLPYASLLALTLGKIGTKRHTAAEIDVLTQGKLGSLTFFAGVAENGDDIANVRPLFTVGSSALSGNVSWLAELPREIMLETDFSDTARILDLLKQHKIVMEQTFANSGHSCAAARVRSYCTPAGVVKEQFGNVGFYRFLCELIDGFDARADELVARLADVAQRVFCDDACTMSFAGSDEDCARFWQAQPTCGRVGEGPARLVIPEPTMAREAFAVPTDVCFAALGWDRRLLGEPHTGSWGVASRALSYDYLWNEVRVKGGAYGVGFKAFLHGDMRFYSYRDPHLDETIARFGQAVPWLASFDPSREDLEGFVVATVAGIDAPVKPRGLIRRQAGDYFSGRTPQTRSAFRRQVVETDVQDVRDLAAPLQRIVDEGALCVFGNREILEASKLGLNVIPLVG